MRLLLVIATVIVVCLLVWQSNDGVDRTRAAGELPVDYESDPADSERNRSAPDGARTNTRVPADSGEPTTHRGACLDVTVRDETDRFRGDVPISLRKTTPNGPEVVARGVTDAKGLVRFKNPGIGRVAVYVDPGGTFDPYFATHWNPDKGYRAVRLRLFRPRAITIQVYDDGKPGIPAGMEIRAPPSLPKTHPHPDSAPRWQVFDCSVTPRLARRRTSRDASVCTSPCIY